LIEKIKNEITGREAVDSGDDVDIVAFCASGIGSRSLPIASCPRPTLHNLTVNAFYLFIFLYFIKIFRYDSFYFKLII
jgi:hypothetical protein